MKRKNEAANLCKIRTSILYADSVFGPTCLEIFSKHVRLTSLWISDFPLSLDEFKALVCQSQNCSLRSAQNLSNFDDEPGKRYLKIISQLFSWIKSPYYELEIQLLRGQQVVSKRPPISSQVFPKKPSWAQFEPNCFPRIIHGKDKKTECVILGGVGRFFL